MITGAIRISFGYMSTRADADAFLQFVVKYFVADNAAAAADLASNITSSSAPPLSTAIIAALPALDSPESKPSSLTTNVATTTNIGAAISADADPKADANPSADIINADPFADSNTDSDSNVHDAIRISALCVYPVKSCGAIRALEWPLGPRGLLFDREWSIVGALSDKIFAIKTNSYCTRVDCRR